MNKWQTKQYQEILAYAYGLKSQYTYKEVCERIYKKFGKIIHHEVLRKHLKRYEGNQKQQQQTTHADVDAIKAVYGNDEIIDEEAEFMESIHAAREKAQKDRDQRLLKRLLEERGRTELIIDMFRTCIQAMPEIDLKPPEPIDLTRSEPEEALLLFSDAQIGEKITLEETNGIGEYNIDIFKERMAKLTTEVRTIAQKQFEPISVLNIAMLGDNVDGINVYRGQEHHLDLNIIDQVLVGCTEIAKSFVHFLDTFHAIRVYGVVGNHGRIGKKGENPSHVNWDYLIYKILQLLLRKYSDRIEWHIPLSNWMIANINENNFLFLHGDTIKGWNGLPYYGIDRADSRLTKMLSAHGRYYRYMCLGHHHNPADIDSPGGEKILNGTMVGGSTFSINTLHTSSRPSQWFFGVNKKGITWRHKILLDE